MATRLSDARKWAQKWQRLVSGEPAQPATYGVVDLDTTLRLRLRVLETVLYRSQRLGVTPDKFLSMVIESYAVRAGLFEMTSPVLLDHDRLRQAWAKGETINGAQLAEFLAAVDSDMPDSAR
jgi:hypothetical protein